MAVRLHYQIVCDTLAEYLLVQSTFIEPGLLLGVADQDEDERTITGTLTYDNPLADQPQEA